MKAFLRKLLVYLITLASLLRDMLMWLGKRTACVVHKLVHIVRKIPNKED